MACRRIAEEKEKADKQRENRILQALRAKDAWKCKCGAAIHRRNFIYFPAVLENAAGKARTKTLLKRI